MATSLVPSNNQSWSTILPLSYTDTEDDPTSFVLRWFLIACIILMLGFVGMMALSVLEWTLGCLVDSYVALTVRLSRRRFKPKKNHRIPSACDPDTPGTSAPSSDDETEKNTKV